jgi:hypothetical protein
MENLISNERKTEIIKKELNSAEGEVKAYAEKKYKEYINNHLLTPLPPCSFECICACDNELRQLMTKVANLKHFLKIHEALNNNHEMERDEKE